MDRLAADLGRAAILGSVYYLAGRFGWSVADSGVAFAPACGIAVAALLLFGYRLFPAVAAGAFFLSLSAEIAEIAALGIALGASLQAVAGAYILKRVDFDVEFKRGKDIFNFFAFGAAASAVFSAGIGVLFLAFTGALA
ncbi:MAG: MASE1 domain-containing protein, partial [Burkholderiales bacterium]